MLTNKQTIAILKLAIKSLRESDYTLDSLSIENDSHAYAKITDKGESFMLCFDVFGELFLKCPLNDLTKEDFEEIESLQTFDGLDNILELVK